MKPKVSIIGEFWAMTTEGDGNYQLQQFLEQEGAECDVQLLAAWLLYTLWEVKNDTKERADLREDVVAAVAPYITKTRAQRWKDRLTAFATGGKKAIQNTPHLAVSFVQAVKEAPKVAERVKEDITILREIRALKKKAANGARAESMLDAAAEE